jgi:hypothetical protein
LLKIKDEIDQKLRTTQELESELKRRRDLEEIERLRQELLQSKLEMERVKEENEIIKSHLLSGKRQLQETPPSHKNREKFQKKQEINKLVEQKSRLQLKNMM